MTDSFRAGKQEMKLGQAGRRDRRPHAARRQVRQAFYGEEAQRDALGGLQRGFTLALLMIFALLAVPLRSYVQSLIIIMSAIPFGLIGAVWGHVFLGLNVSSIMSMFGLVALTGVVVNDSLIMVDFINRARGVHADVGRLARQAGGVRPIGGTSRRPAWRWRCARPASTASGRSC